MSSLRPELVVVAEVSADQSRPSLPLLVKGCLAHLWPVLDLHDKLLKVGTPEEDATPQAEAATGVGRRGVKGGGKRKSAVTMTTTATTSSHIDDPDQPPPQSGHTPHMLAFEDVVFGQFLNMSLGPSATRLQFIHTRTAAQWSQLMRSCALAEHPISNDTQEFLTRCTLGLPPELTIEFEPGHAYFCWKKQPILCASLWGAR